MAELQKFSLEEINLVAAQVIERCSNEPVWLFEGSMGAGKTTLIKAICQELKVLNTVQSPTFSIVNEYLTASGDIIYHFDCYRLKNEIEAYDIGIEEYLDSGNLCLIEWPDKIKDLLPQIVARIKIEEIASRSRRVMIEIVEK
ncbi:MAG: tRNA (adenosine(37)-N6)-threonylcarbamoyltransferase complex ATPase subunit type 1 TsaE [Spirosomataceae bacterium]